MKKSVYVLLGIPADTEYGRGVTQGIIRFAATTNWILGTAPLNGELAADADTSHWSVEEKGGGIGLIETPKQAAAFQALKIPCVSISSALEDSTIPYVSCDQKIIGSLAASHFLERQMRHFGFVGLPDRSDTDARRVGFTERLAVDGITKVSFHDAPKKFDPDSFKKLSEWIDSLSKPVGIFAMNDALGRTVIDACRAVNIKVPSAVAVLGCGNDPVICGLASPSLSSVALPAERVGFEAADMLAALMLNPKRPMERQRQIPVSSVIPRESTDNVSVRDPDVASALRFILAHAGEWIGVRELLLALPVQRRSLERKFRKVLGRSPLEEIRRVRIDLAKQLLSNTDLPMPIVARRSGFSEAKQLSQVFRALVGTTPTSYRSNFRLPEKASSDGAGAVEMDDSKA
jgi:LacI family transcriptional regulator